MSESQTPAAALWIPRLLLGVPAAVGGLLALLVLAIGSLPLASQLQLQGRQVEEKLALEQRLPSLRAQLSTVAAQQAAAERQQQQLITLIAGSGELVTFMAQVDREARRHGVELQLYEPNAAVAAADPDKPDPLRGQKKGTRAQLEHEAASKKAAAAPIAAHPLQQAGLQSTRLLLSAKGRFPNLLAFLRALEALSLLVVQSNLNLSQDQAAGASPIELKLAVALYNAKR
jgi:type IV pilus assembly protein PilO